MLNLHLSRQIAAPRQIQSCNEHHTQRASLRNTNTRSEFKPHPNMSMMFKISMAKPTRQTKTRQDTIQKSTVNRVKGFNNISNKKVNMGVSGTSKNFRTALGNWKTLLSAKFQSSQTSKNKMQLLRGVEPHADSRDWKKRDPSCSRKKNILQQNSRTRGLQRTNCRCCAVLNRVRCLTAGRGFKNKMQNCLSAQNCAQKLLVS